MLEHHYKTHYKPQKTAPKPQPEPEPEEREMPEILFVNNEMAKPSTVTAMNTHHRPTTNPNQSSPASTRPTIPPTH
jgi:hypothetical protein